MWAVFRAEKSHSRKHAADFGIWLEFSKKTLIYENVFDDYGGNDKFY